MHANRLLTILKIRPDETQMAVLVALLFALIELGRGIGGSAADALFFRRFGVEYLPYLYIALGITTFFASLSYAAFLGQVAKQRFFPFLLLLMAAALLAERAAILLDLRVLYPVLWLTVNLIGALLGTLAWNTAGEVCDTRQAKRLFPIFVSAGILGGLLGSLIIGPAARLFGTDNLILIYVVLLAIGLLLVREIARRHFQTTTRTDDSSSFLTDIRAGFDYVKRSPLLQRLAVSAVLFSILYFSISFPFGRAVSASFSTEADLAGFLGLFNGMTSALMFIAALLIANRLYARIGIVNALLLLPITYLLGFVLFAIQFSLTSAVVVRLSQLVVLSGIGDGAYSTFFNVVPPERRAQVRAFDSGVPAQIGIVLSGILLILGERALTNTEIFVMGMIVAVLCAVVVWRMRQHYADALVAALRAGRIEVFTTGERVFVGFGSDVDAIRIITSALDDPKPVTQQLAVEMLVRIGAEPAVPTLIRRLPGASDEVRVAILRGLGQLQARQAVRPVATLLQDVSPTVRGAALEALPSLYDPADPELARLIRPMLADPEFTVRIQAAISVAHYGDADTAIRTLTDFLQDADDEKTRIAVLHAFEAVLKAAPPSPEERLNETAGQAIIPHLQAESAAVRRAACSALSSAPMPDALQALAECLADPVPGVRTEAARALRKADHAAVSFVVPLLFTKAAPTALDALPVGDPAIYSWLRRYAQFELERLRVLRQAYRAIPHTGRVTRLLSSLLEAKAVQTEQNLIKAIGLFGHETTMQLIAKALNTADSQARSAAVEALDTLGDKQLVRAFVPLLEAEARGPDGVGEAESVINDLIAGEDAWLRAVALRAVGELELHNLMPDVQEWAAGDDRLAREAACETIHDLGGTVETLTTLSLVERTLLLKDVPLFSDLSPDDLVQIARIAQERWFSDGSILCREGETGDELFVVAAGQVQVTKQASGQEQVLATRRIGEYVGEMSVIDSMPRSATVRALGDARTLVISSEMFKAILRDRPEVSLAVMRGLSRRLRERH